MEARSLPMWTQTHLVRLKQAEGASQELLQELLQYLERPSESTALLVEYAGDLGTKGAPSAWKAVLEKIEARDCGPRGARAYVTGRARAEGYALDTDTASALEEWACGDLGKLASAMDLLALYKKDETVSRAEDLESLLGAGGAPRAWDLQDAFLKGDRRVFLQILEGVRRDADVAPLAFLGMLAKQIRAALLFQGHRARGKAAGDIGFKELGFQSTYPAQKVVATAGRWPEQRIRRTLGALFELDLALKGDPGEPWTILERGLIKLM
jgi:DNA polymerase III delta subunit